MDHVSRYLTSLVEKLLTGEAREHAYRPPFEELLKSIAHGCQVINDPSRSEFGAPDFVVLKGSVPLAYIETKDLGDNLDKVEKTEQIERYRGYPKLILTNYIEFRFFRDGEPYGEKISIASRNGPTLYFNHNSFELLVRDFAAFLELGAQTITSASKLALIMGGRARRLRDNIILFSKNPEDKNKMLLEQFEVFKKLLISDLTIEQFADMYAQTLVYGLFVARYSDTTLKSFNRQEAQYLIPRSNPFLRQFFSHIAGQDFDKRLDYIVSDLCEIFAAADVKKIMDSYFKEGLWGGDSEQPDPVIHFYEDFLKDYDPKERTKRGVFYTPLPIARFIIRSVDQILKKEFNLSKGLADTAKIETLGSVVHRVQILDPAVGTGTFLSEVVHKIYESFEGPQKGQWSSYVNDHLLPRLHGFELMMTSYTIAHLKLAMILDKTGATLNNRLGIYLTNSLEKGSEVQLQLDLGFMKSITEESVRASHIKEEMPIMVVIGNPPYSAISSNKSAKYLVEKYKVEPGGIVRLKERKNWLDDDYVKFISFAESLIDKNGEGVLAYITNNGFIDNPTFRGMRWHLLKTFNDIYIVDLHGNAKKKEKSPDGSKDENVFNIMQGVSINIFVKKNKGEKGLGSVHHVDLYGRREGKFDFLNKNSLESIRWNKIETTLPNLFFINKGNIKDEEQYNQGFSVGSPIGGLFIKNSCGVVTMGDNFIVDIDKDVLIKRLSDFLENDISAVNLKTKYELGKNYANWVVENKTKIKIDNDKIIKFSYRPFDDRFTVFDKNLIWRTRENVMKDVYVNNFSMVFEKIASNKYQPVGIYLSKNIIDCHLTGGQSYIGNLYSINDNNEKESNLNYEIVNKIEKIVGKVSPEDIFDYIYAVLHSPSYREKYKEFLKIDFPRVPYPKNTKQFSALAEKGKELKLLHLLEHPILDKFITTFPAVGGNYIDGKHLKYKDEKVFINQTQYFGNVPEVAWNFWIGGYQPAQKWLKDRKGRLLSSDDLNHYQKIIIALTETDRIMKEIDDIFLKIS